MCIASLGYINPGEELINWSNIGGGGMAYQFCATATMVTADEDDGQNIGMMVRQNERARR